MRLEIKLPDLGDDATVEASVSHWFVGVGGHVAQGDDLVELTTDKAAFTVPAPESGSLLERAVETGDTIAVGDLLCILDT